MFLSSFTLPNLGSLYKCMLVLAFSLLCCQSILYSNQTYTQTVQFQDGFNRLNPLSEFHFAIEISIMMGYWLVSKIEAQNVQ